jgi:hypothetical protein
MSGSLYDKLKQQKQNGIFLSWDDITYEELFTLWGREATPDSMIAALYDVDKKDVTKKRHQWDIKKYNTNALIFSELITAHMNDKTGLEKMLEDQELSNNVKEISRLIKELSRSEKNALISSLSETDDVFKQVAEAARYWCRFNEGLGGALHNLSKKHNE